MASLKLLFGTVTISILFVSISAGLLDAFYPMILTEHFSQVPTKEGYRFNLTDPNGSKREEIGIIMNPGTENEELVVMGTYSSIDEKTNTETVTMYTADKNGYRPMFKIRKLSAGALKSAAG